MNFVLDCSITMSWCFEDESDKNTDAILDKLTESEAFVPSIWPLEIINVLLIGEKQKRLTKASSLRFIELIHSLPITIDDYISNHTMYELYALSHEYSLTSYDTAYLELAIRKGLPLTTKDKALKKAAKKCGVILIEC